MTEQWRELKETIIAMRDSDGKCTQQEVCVFLINYMEVLEKQIQEPKAGHWKDIPKYKDIAWQCSECKHFTTMKHNYCPNCGARMVEPKESEDKE